MMNIALRGKYCLAVLCIVFLGFGASAGSAFAAALPPSCGGAQLSGLSDINNVVNQINGALDTVNQAVQTVLSAADTVSTVAAVGSAVIDAAATFASRW